MHKTRFFTKMSVAFLLLWFQGAKGQELKSDVYYYNGQQIPLDINYNSFFLAADTVIDHVAIFGQYGYTIDSLISGEDIKPSQHWIHVKINNATLNLSQYNNLVNNLRVGDGLTVEPVIGDTSLVPVSNFFYVRLNNAGDSNQLKSLAVNANATLLGEVSYMPKWYKLKADAQSQGNSLQLTNLFYESGLFADVDPGFVFNFQLGCGGVADDVQWMFNNISDPNLDVNACDAWGVTYGDSSIKIAVIDQGINHLHTELDENMYPWRYDAYLDSVHDIGKTPHDYYQTYGYHGTVVAGLAASERNGDSVVGIAPSTTIIDVAYPFDIYPLSSTYGEELARGFGWASRIAGADIINNSWSNSTFSPQMHSKLLEDAIWDAIQNGRNGKGCLVTFISHNQGQNRIFYPADQFPEILVIGNMDTTGLRHNKSNYAPGLDLMAPGTFIRSPATVSTPYIPFVTNAIGSLDFGTSYAAPIASGVASLALAVNPCLTGDDVRQIMEKTAQKVGGYPYTPSVGRPNGTWNEEMGYGLVDAKAVVDKAQELYSNQLELYIKDTPHDLGEEPNPDPGGMYVSEDIWIRNQPDGIEEHENPVYNPIHPKVYVYVRVRNKSCVDLVTPPYVGFVNLYWAKARTNLSWPRPWQDLPGTTTPALGGQIGTSLILPNIPAGGDTVVMFEWDFPNPMDFITTIYFSDIEIPISELAESYHHCLLAEVLLVGTGGHTNQNPMGNVLVFARDNNSVATKNIVNGVYSIALVGWGGPFDAASDTYVLEFRVPINELDFPLTAEAEVTITLDSLGWAIWQAGGAVGHGFQILDAESHKLLALEPSMHLGNLFVEAGQNPLVLIEVNFLTEETTEKMLFTYDMVQKKAADGVEIGGERLIVNKPPREELFIANGFIGTSAGQQPGIELQASSINEPAFYRWYKAMDTSLVDTGMTITVNPIQNTDYLLEITAKADGFKDYSNSLQVPAQQNVIVSLTPNPATGQVTVAYDLSNSVQIAQLTLTSATNPNNHASYMLNTKHSQAIINLGSLPIGIYVVNLSCDGQLADSKQLSIQ